MRLSDLFDEVDILDITYTEFKKLIIKNKVVRSDFNFERLKHNIKAYKKYMASDIISLKEFSINEGIDSKKFISFVSRYGLDIKSTTFNVKLAMQFKENHPELTTVSIAKQFGCHVQTLYKYTHLKNKEIGKCKTNENKLLVEKAYQYYIEHGCTKRFVERKFSIHKGAILRYMKKLDNGGHENDKREKRVQIQSSNGF